MVGRIILALEAGDNEPRHVVSDPSPGHDVEDLLCFVIQ